MSVRLLVTAFNAFPAVKPDLGNAVGGVETFAWSISRAVACQQDFKVTFFVRDPSALKIETIDQVKVVNVIEPLRGTRLRATQCVKRIPHFPWVKVIRWDPNLIWQIPLLLANRCFGPRVEWRERIQKCFREIAPEILMAPGVNQDIAAVISIAHEENVPSLIWLQSNVDLDPRYWSEPLFRSPYGVCRADAEMCLSADLVICQTQWQQEALKRVSSVPSVVIRNPVDLHQFSPGTASYATRKEVLWIGRYDDFHKRPLLAMEVARQCPEIPFRMIINPGREGVEEKVRAARPSNVTIVDYIANDRIPEAFRQARIYMSTGSKEFEGFPNVFLESAASGTPICSLEDFDQFIQRSNVGFCAEGEVDRLASQVRELWSNSSLWTRCSNAGQAYVREHHSIEIIRDQFLSVVADVLNRQGTGK